MNVDTVIFAIGDRVDDKFGLPVQWNEFVKNPEPGFPVDGISYEAFDPQANKSLAGNLCSGLVAGGQQRVGGGGAQGWRARRQGSPAVP